MMFVKPISPSVIFGKPTNFKLNRITFIDLYSYKYYSLLPGDFILLETGLIFDENVSILMAKYYFFQVSLDLWRKEIMVYPGMFEIDVGKDILVPIMRLSTTIRNNNAYDIFGQNKIEIPRNSKIGQLVIYSEMLT